MAEGKATKRRTIVDIIKVEQMAPVMLLVIVGKGNQVIVGKGNQVIVGGSYTSTNFPTFSLYQPNPRTWAHQSTIVSALQ